jgi:CDP-glucose 4,6-dehydratase
VLEPLSGYLKLARALHGQAGPGFAQAWNFGPQDASVVTVGQMAQCLVDTWGRGEVVIARDPGQPHEAGLLKLDCSKARARLGWQAVWGFPETIRRTVEWYRDHSLGEDPERLTLQQIKAYQEDLGRTGPSESEPA